MNKFLKTAITATFAAAAFVGAAAAQEFNHTSETQSVLVLNDFQAQTNLVLGFAIDAKINTMVAAAATDMATLPALNTAEINTQAVASTEKASDALSVAMASQIEELIANGPKPQSFAFASND